MDIIEVLHKLIDRAQLYTESEVKDAKAAVERTFPPGTGADPNTPTADETVSTGTVPEPTAVPTDLGSTTTITPTGDATDDGDHTGI